MGMKRAAQKRKARPSVSPDHPSSDSNSLEEEVLGTSADSRPHIKTSSKKPAPFQRVWSEENELALLNGILRFKAEEGMELMPDTMKNFYDFVLEFLAEDFKRSQIRDKVRKLKIRFLNISAKQVSHSDSHERKVLELSAKIWGPSSAQAGAPDTLPKEEPASNFNLDVKNLKVGVVSDLVQKATESTGSVGMEGRLKGLKKGIQVAELELFLKKTELLKQQLTLVLEAPASFSNK